MRRCASKTPEALAHAVANPPSKGKGKEGKGKTKSKGGVLPAHVLAALKGKAKGKGKHMAKGKGSPDETPPTSILKRKTSDDPTMEPLRTKKTAEVPEHPEEKKQKKSARAAPEAETPETPEEKQPKKKKKNHVAPADEAETPETPEEKKLKKKKNHVAPEDAAETSETPEEKKPKKKDRVAPEAETSETPDCNAPGAEGDDEKPKRKLKKKKTQPELSEPQAKTPETRSIASTGAVDTPSGETVDYCESAEERRSLKAQTAEASGGAASMTQTRLDDLKHVIKTPRQCPPCLGQKPQPHTLQTKLGALWGWAGQQASASKGKGKGKGKSKDGGLIVTVVDSLLQVVYTPYKNTTYIPKSAFPQVI